MSVNVVVVEKGIRRVFQKGKLLCVFGNPGFGGGTEPVPKARVERRGKRNPSLSAFGSPERTYGETQSA